MSDDAKGLREKMKEKARRMAGGKDEVPGATTWRPAEPLDAEVKTGMRPISRRAFKSGGKVDGEQAQHHAGRPARASGGKAIADAIVNRNQKEANEEREGKKHVGGMKSGGRAEKADGGRAKKNLGGPSGLYGMQTQPTGKNIMPTAAPKKKAHGGATKKAIGGVTGVMPPSDFKDARRPVVSEEVTEKVVKEKEPVRMIHSAIKGGAGYVKPDIALGLAGPGKNFEGMIKPTNPPAAQFKAAKAAPVAVAGRSARQDGGRTNGKKSTNINIIIAPQGAKQDDQSAAPPMGAMPGGGLPKPPMPPVAAPSPAAMPGPPAGLAAALAGGAGGPPHPGGMPPIPRKDGGVVKMKHGAGGGLGRLEKIEKYGDNA